MDERPKDEAAGMAAPLPAARPPHRMPPGHPAPVRVLLRGLELIHALNRHGPLTTAALSQKLRLARTTVNRCLATLEGMDLVQRDDSRRFALTLRAKTLSHGFDSAAERLEPVRRALAEAAPRVQWPVSLMRFHFPDMIVEDSTDRSSGFAVEFFERGTLLPVLTTASGRVYLAYCSPRVRETILEHLWPQRPEETHAAWADMPALERDLASIRERGYAKAIRPLRLTEQGSIAIPVMVDGEPIGALAVRFALTAVSFEDARRRLLPALQEIAHRPA
jgi:IclR family transcriptional regulator, mhp operon transcriptional activator